MKKFRAVLAMVLALSLLMSLAASAVQTLDGDWQADIRALMDDSLVPKSTSLELDHSLPEGTSVKNHTYSVDRVNNTGMTMRVELVLATTGEVTDEEWSAIDAWLEKTTDSAILGVAVETEAMATAVAEAVEAGRQSAASSSDAAASPWGRADVLLQSVTVTLPFYPELTDGVNGSATQKLQERLIQLGYLDDVADGYYGGKTAAAVRELEEYIRELEQDLIDARPTPEPTATPTPAPTMAVAQDVPMDATAEPEAEPEPQATPATPVDGVADALLQAYLYSDDFVTVRTALTSGDQGDAVLRLQRRLIQLGCMVGTADGIYGGDTARSVRIFQYYNGLTLTGVADVETQKLLYSSNAKAPDNGMMSEGASGDEVKKLQLRLRVLGFMNGSVDGDYGATTSKGVQNLQQYMRDLEEAAIRADAEQMAQLETTGADISTLLTVEVNGIADPILLDDFYAESFPAMPSPMQSGSTGPDVVRLQRRLNCLEYYYGSLDGEYGGGTSSAITAFQKRHGLEQTGEANAATLAVLFSEDALKALKPYVVKVSTADQRVYVYGLDENNEHTVLVRTMKCSTGRNETPTPKGTYQSSTGPGARWHYFKKFKCWAQYAYYIQGDIMFHSVLYNEKDGPVTQSSVNNLGRKASHGCVRLSVEDAKWLYKNCPRNTKIVVY